MPPTLESRERQEDDIFTVDPNTWAKMIETEQGGYFHELSLTKRTFTLNGVTFEYDSNVGPVTTTFGGSSDKSEKSS